MKAHVITIGDEILIGQIIDTNSAWIAARLNEIGVSVERKVTVGDEKNEIKNSVLESMSRAEVTVITGGLGPTKDDITKNTLAELFDTRLVHHQSTFDFVKKMLSLRGIEMNELNCSQTMVPESCTVLPNPNGTAPGMWFERNGRVVVSLPGVPFEMEQIVLQSVLPMIASHFALQSVVHKTAITFGLAESMLAMKIAAWENDLPAWLHLAYLPSPSQVRLRLSAYDVDKKTAQSEIDRRFDALTELIPSYFIGYGDETVVSATAGLLKQRGKTLSVAESCTGGALSAKFTALAGASEYFMGGVVSYDNTVKTGVLGVDAATLEAKGAVSREVAEQMAVGVRKLCKTDYAISTTGIAGPTGGSDEKPVGTVWMAIASAEGVVSYKMTYGKLRTQNIERAAVSAINFLRLVMIGRTDSFINPCAV